ncbi:MAG TPA: hypothetical protein VHE30_14035 [Polyangiaceae bacterium]|nr:hypothetical protein [Polyangiaceae bacterium]
MRGFGVLVALLAVSAAGCDASEGERPKEWVCCASEDGGGACECVDHSGGGTVDCFGRGVSACTTKAQCVLQGGRCTCSDDARDLPTGSDAVQVDQCPPK